MLTVLLIGTPDKNPNNDNNNEEHFGYIKYTPSYALLTYLFENLKMSETSKAKYTNISAILAYMKLHHASVKVVLYINGIDIILKALDKLDSDYDQLIYQKTSEILQLIVKFNRTGSIKLLSNFNGWYNYFFIWTKSDDPNLLQNASQIVHILYINESSLSNNKEHSISYLELLNGLLINKRISKESIYYITKTINLLAAESNQNKKLIIDMNLLNNLKDRLQPFNTTEDVIDGRSLVNVARILSYASQLDEDYKRRLIQDGWAEILVYMSKSPNKKIRLATVHALDNLLLDDVIAVKIIQQYGMELFIELAEMIDIDLHHAVEKIITRFKRNEEIEHKTGNLFLIDEKFNAFNKN